MNGSKNLEALIKDAEGILKNRLGSQNAYNTYRTYRLHCLNFITWSVKKHKCATLSEARDCVLPWLQSRSKMSENTRRVDASALAKLYGEDRQCFFLDSSYPLDPNRRTLRIFCKATGLIKHELSFLKEDCLMRFNDQCFIRLNMPGDLRIIPVIENSGPVIHFITRHGAGQLWPVLPDAFDYEAARTHYIAKLYKKQARSIPCIAENEQYHFHDTAAVFDKRALFEVALATGIYDYSVLAFKINCASAVQHSKT